MSQLYPGVAPLTVHTSGAGAPGIIVSTGVGDVHGNFPIVTEMTGPDKRFAGNLMQPSENLTDRQNWMGWRILDIWAGGDYSTANGTISLGGTWKWFPPPGAYAIRVAGTAGGGAALIDVAQNGAGAGVSVAQTGVGDGISATASAGSGYALRGIGPGVAGKPAIACDSGPLLLTGANGSLPAGAPGANTLYGSNICKAIFVGTCTGGGSSTVITANRTHNITMTMDASGNFATVFFVTAMADKYYVIEAQYENAGVVSFQAATLKTAAGFQLSFQNTSNVAIDLRISVGGVITLTIHGWQ